MYILIGETTYDDLTKLQFEPQTDVTGSTVPVNELWVSIKTDDTISIGDRVSLYDDNDNLWCKYWITYAERENAYYVRVHGQSALKKLDTIMMDPVMYSNESVTVVIASILNDISDEYTLDSSFNSKVISGFCPKQSARVRLQWVCMCIGAYLKNFFNDELEILPMDDDEVGVIPVEQTYWKPKITYKDHVTAVRCVYYSYVQDTPSRTDKYVEVNGTYYVQTETSVLLTNTAAPAAAMENVVEVSNVTLINEDNVSDVLSFLAKYYFKRMTIDMSCVDNGDWYPGQRVLCYTDEDTMYSGYINSCSFRFGVQAKATMKLTPTEIRGSAALNIIFTYNNIQVGIRTYRLPVGYAYEIDNPYLDVTMQEHRYIFRPTIAKTTGTMVNGGVTVTVPMEVALDYYVGEMRRGMLRIVNVDEVNDVDHVAVIK